MSRPKIKVMLVVIFDCRGIFHQEFVLHGQVGYKEGSVQGITRTFNECCGQEDALIVENQSWILHLDNATTHDLLFVRNNYVKYPTPVVPHLLYSQILTLAHFFLFPRLKTTLKGRRFQTTEEIHDIATTDLRAIVEGCAPKMEWRSSKNGRNHGNGGLDV
ncbi:uncharacterized protein LOC118192454 [Stegodyphus dumicola]|uniref:uncharacterized protein LOC118192454 n=1 Tax=Stegodyphus dumicola TaxID=202533 RepID=UPI0015AE9294|nr:uncharacterized protein LOC118192454 [Stegodyphus dumicola]